MTQLPTSSRLKPLLELTQVLLRRTGWPVVGWCESGVGRARSGRPRPGFGWGSWLLGDGQARAGRSDASPSVSVKFTLTVERKTPPCSQWRIGRGKGPLMAQALVEQLRVSLQAIERFDTRIDVAAQALPDYALFRALAGAGPTYAPRRLAAFGEQRLVEAAFLQPARYSELEIFLLTSVSWP